MLADTEDNYSDVITHTSGTATQVDVAVSGECYPPAVTWNITQSLVPFSATAGTPSANQSYTLGTTTATGDITVATTAPFELSTTGSSGWLTELTLPYTFNATVYVRMNASAASTYNAEITHNTADASPNAFSISGTATAPAGSYAADLFFSEYVEGSGNRKAIEIFNGTGSSVDLADYSIMKQVNGAGAFGNEKVLVGTLAHGDVYVIVYSNASNSLKDELYVDLASSEGFMSFNGNDAIALYHSSVQTDVIGIVDQVTPDWGKDVTLVRKPTIITPTTSFSFDDWNSFAIDTFTDLGMHTFTPGGATEYVANPTFDPPAGYKTSAFDVTIATETVGATIRYTLDGNAPDVSSAVFTPPLNISSTTTLKAIAYKDGYTPSSIMTAIYTFPVDVSNIAALRASAQGATVYRLTGEAVLTFQQAGRNQKYIQDATGAIVIDDLSGIITSTYALYDGITGIAGTIALYNGLLQFTPVANPGTATSSNNVVTPAVRTLATITTDDQAKLLKIMNVTLTPSVLGTFLATAENIVAADASGAGTLRTFPDADYATTTIPATPVNITCLGGQFGDAMQFSPRFLTDIEAAGGTLDTPVVVITQDGTDVVLTWGEITGATGGYRIESSDEPYTGFTTVTTTSLLTWSGTAVSKKFFRVIALP